METASAPNPRIGNGLKSGGMYGVTRDPMFSGVCFKNQMPVTFGDSNGWQ